MQVLGSLNKAMESMAVLNRIVWEEVMHKCREESFRITTSFRLSMVTADRAAQGRTQSHAALQNVQMSDNVEREHAQKQDQQKAYRQDAQKAQSQQTESEESATALGAASQHSEAGPPEGGISFVDEGSCQAAAAGVPTSPLGYVATSRRESLTAEDDLPRSCNGGTANGRHGGPDCSSSRGEKVAAEDGRQSPSGERQHTDSGASRPSVTTPFSPGTLMTAGKAESVLATHGPMMHPNCSPLP